MFTNLIENFFFLPELFRDLQNPLKRKYFLKYIQRYLRGLFWLILYWYPSRNLKLIGVTGTDGKTTVTNLVYHVLEKAGKKVSVISTIYGKIGDQVFDTGFHVTTPNASLMQKYFDQAYKSGSEYFIVEATSHGLDQYRLFGAKFKVGILTNITHEHLDYHITFDNYLKVKAKLFEKSEISVLNMDDKSYPEIKNHSAGEVITYGFSKMADLNLDNFKFKTSLPGEYNKYNILAAAACCRALGIDDQVIKTAVADFQTLSGRMEEVKNKKGLNIVVDFAHTPNALEQALKSLKKETKGKLICVFGAAAERDLEKRPVMGKISASLADIIVLTDEDPRFEDRKKIIEEIAAGAYKAGATDLTLFKESDRALAIRLAISMAKKGDTIGIFGKGHEKSMNYLGVEQPWSDQGAVLEALNDK